MDIIIYYSLFSRFWRLFILTFVPFWSIFAIFRSLLGLVHLEWHLLGSKVTLDPLEHAWSPCDLIFRRGWTLKIGSAADLATFKIRSTISTQNSSFSSCIFTLGMRVKSSQQLKYDLRGEWAGMGKFTIAMWMERGMGSVEMYRGEEGEQTAMKIEFNSNKLYVFIKLLRQITSNVFSNRTQ